MQVLLRARGGALRAGAPGASAGDGAAPAEGEGDGAMELLLQRVALTLAAVDGFADAGESPPEF